MRRIRHLAVLCRDTLAFSSSVGALWLLPLLLILLITALAAITVHTAVPYVVYTFF